MSKTREIGNSMAKISDEVIAVCTINATLKTKGVARLAESLSNTISKNILGKELTSKGVKVNQTDKGAEINVYIIVDYNVAIPAVAWDIQENVKNEVQSITDVPVITVNIHVQGVEIPQKEQISYDEERSTRDNDADSL